MLVKVISMRLSVKHEPSAKSSDSISGKRKVVRTVVEERLVDSWRRKFSLGKSDDIT